MEIKRLILATVLSVAIFMGWNFFVVYMGWVPEAPDPATENATVQMESGTVAAPVQTAGTTTEDPSASRLPAFVPSEGRLVTVETPLYKAVLHSGGGVLRQFSLKQYRVGISDDSPLVDLVSEAAAGQAPMGVMVGGVSTWAGGEWAFEGDDLNLEDGATAVLRFTTEVEGLQVVRELGFSGSDYTITEKLYLSAPVHREVNVAFTFGASSLSTDKRPSIFSSLRHAIFGGEAPEDEESQYNTTRVAWYQDASFDEKDAGSLGDKGHLVQNKVSWMAVMNNYFMGAVSMNEPGASAKGRFLNGVYHVLIGKTGVPVRPGEASVVEAAYFFGPKDGKVLESLPNNMGKALDYGFFSIVAKPLVYLLQFFYGFVHNYGIAVILMTVLIKLIFWPLSQKSYKSMQQMKQIQPMMAKLREKYAGDKEALNREVMQLYKTYKINPAGGCLPILVQIPVFFGLYKALLNAIELRHAPFISTLPFTDSVWLADLASPDPFLITPLLMGASMLLQQKMTPAPGDPTQAKIMMFMPIIFTVLFLGFPSGLVVYWLVNNIISMGQQWLQLRKTAAPKP